jgi:RNA polymerase sigma-70 factor (ECF subfamily)
MQNDAALARRLLAGDDTAFDEFFARYFPRVYRFARTRLGNDEDAAEEVAQRVLIRGLERLHTYRGEAALLTWLCTICRREIGEWLGRRNRRREVSLSDDRPELLDVLETIATADPDPEADFRLRELSALVHATLDHLPGHYGDVLEWKYIHELSVDEIAGRLGVGYKAAESLLTRARAAFREGFSLVAGEWQTGARSGRPRSAEGS